MVPLRKPVPGRTSPQTRARGEHFLVSQRAVAAILDAAALQPGESVLDVGSGAGALARPAAQAVHPGGSVTAIEKQPRWAQGLRAEGLPGVQVVQGNALRVRLPARIDAIVANPPFRILPALLRRLLDHGFGRAVLVVPQELADRLTAQARKDAPGPHYGKLTVQVGVRAKATRLGPIPRRAFEPRPEVDCALLKVVPKAAGLREPTALAVLDEVLDHAWTGRARTLRHALAPLAGRGWTPQQVSDALQPGGARDRRFHEVSPWEFGQIAAVLAPLRADDY